jgi:hypothetical protein
MKLRDFLNNFNDAGKTIIDLYFSGITFKISVGYNHIEVDTKECGSLFLSEGTYTLYEHVGECPFCNK